MVPKHLESTWQLLKRTFPSGMSDAEYFAVLALLYPHMADENLAIVMSEFAGRHTGVVLNDIYAVGAGSAVATEARASVVRRLKEFGFDEWVTDDG